MARILIAGCGDIGTTLGLSLNAAGHRVWGLKRRPDDLPPALLACFRAEGFDVNGDRLPAG